MVEKAVGTSSEEYELSGVVRGASSEASAESVCASAAAAVAVDGERCK